MRVGASPNRELRDIGGEPEMDTWMWAVIVAGAAIIVALVIFAIMRRRRTRGLKRTFGTEYDRVVDVRGGRREAERDLVDRRDRRDEIQDRKSTRLNSSHLV